MKKERRSEKSEGHRRTATIAHKIKIASEGHWEMEGTHNISFFLHPFLISKTSPRENLFQKHFILFSPILWIVFSFNHFFYSSVAYFSDLRDQTSVESNFFPVAEEEE